MLPSALPRGGKARPTLTALARAAAFISSVRKLVDKHSFEDILLVVPVVEDILVKHIKNRRLYYSERLLAVQLDSWCQEVEGTYP